MATKTKTKKAPPGPATAYEILAGLRLRNGESYTEEMQASAACEYLDCLLVATRGLSHFAERSNAAWLGDRGHLHETWLRAVVAAYEKLNDVKAGEDDYLALAVGYIEHLEALDRTQVLGFREWLGETLELPDGMEISPEPTPEDDMVVAGQAAPAPARRPTRNNRVPLEGQGELPLAAPATAPWEEPAPAEVPAPGKAKGAAKDLAGRRVRYRKGKAWVVGRVVSCEPDETLTLRVEGSDADIPGVPRAHAKLLKEVAAVEEAPVVEKEPDLTIHVPAKVVRRYDKLLSEPGSFRADEEPHAVLKAYTKDADPDGVSVVHVEVTNGDAVGGSGVYVDIFVSKAGKGGKRKVAYGHPPADHLAGRHEIVVDNKPYLLEVLES